MELINLLTFIALLILLFVSLRIEKILRKVYSSQRDSQHLNAMIEVQESLVALAEVIIISPLEFVGFPNFEYTLHQKYLEQLKFHSKLASCIFKLEKYEKVPNSLFDKVKLTKKALDEFILFNRETIEEIKKFNPPLAGSNDERYLKFKEEFVLRYSLKVLEVRKLYDEVNQEIYGRGMVS